jgi:hypothetical protein
MPLHAVQALIPTDQRMNLCSPVPPLILTFSPQAKITAKKKEFSLALQAQRSSRERERVRVTNTWPGQNLYRKFQHLSLPAGG